MHPNPSQIDKLANKITKTSSQNQECREGVGVALSSSKVLISLLQINIFNDLGPSC